MKKIEITKTDLFIYDQEIRPYLPEKIFDAHCHLMQTEFHQYDHNPESDPFFYDVDMKDLEQCWQVLFPDSQVNGLIMGMPTFHCDLDAENNFVGKSVIDPLNRFSLMTHPNMPIKSVKQAIETSRPAGLKPYLLFANVEDKENANITDFLPEEHVELANEFGLVVTLHVSKPRGMADPENLKQIRRLVRQYPACQFILAHCGRCFIPPNMDDALKSLPTAENLWIDTSAVCDVGVFLHLFSRYDLSRILFGTDLVTPAAFRGSYVRLGMGWHICTHKLLVKHWGQADRSTFAVYENLAAFFQAARFCKLKEDDFHNIFYRNAARLFNLFGTGSGTD